MDGSATLVSWVHHLLVLFMVYVPLYVMDPQWLLIHSVVGVSLLVHWYFNDNMCCLTQLEAWLRGVDLHETGAHAVASRVFERPDEVYWWTTTALVLVSMYKLRRLMA